MKRTILLAIAFAVVTLWFGPWNDMSAPIPPAIGINSTNDNDPAGLVDTLTPGLVLEVTAYNVGVRRQTSDHPCIGATGLDLCRLVTRGIKICAANFVDTETILDIEGYGECVVLDRISQRFSNRVDIAMAKEEVDRALEFGIQRRYVKVKPEGP